MENIDTNGLVGLATDMYHIEYMKEEYEDNLCNELLFAEECKAKGKTIEDCDAAMPKCDKKELDATCDALPGYEPYDDIVRMIQSSDNTMTMDTAMGINHEVSDDQIVAELEACMKEACNKE